MGMTLFGGERVSLTTGVPSLNSMGVALGRIVRFCGHTKKFYTVLPHSLVVASLLPEREGIYGLMHDTQEILTSDVPTPMKTQVARNREAVLQKRIYIAYGLKWPVPEEIQGRVDEADHTALVAEALVLGHPAGEAYWGGDMDAQAAKLTRTYCKPAKIANWLDADYAGPFFEKTFAKYAKLAGLDMPDWG